METVQQPKCLLFETEVGGPMTFTFLNVFNIERKKLTEIIQNNGGKVVEYSNKHKFTIVLTKHNKQSNQEVQFDLKYIYDCKKKNEILPLETYRLDKKVDVGCYYSKPLGSTQCIFNKLIQRGRCRKHRLIPSSQNSEKDSISDGEAILNIQLNFMRSQIYVERSPQVKSESRIKIEPHLESMEEEDTEEESQCFGTKTPSEKSQSISRWRKLK